MAFLQFFSDYDWVYHHSLDRHPKPEDFEDHIHPTKYEIMYVIAGRGQYYAEDQVYPVYPGMLFIARNKERHHVEPDPDQPFERIVFLFAPDQIRKFDPEGMLLASFDNRAMGTGNAYTDAVFHQPKLILQGQPYNPTPAELRIFAVSQVFSFLCEIYAAYTSAQIEDSALRSKQKVIQPALDFIHEHLFEKITVREVSEQAYISESQLNKLFKAVLGASVYEYILDKRLAAAKFKIDSGMGVTQAAFDCGFNSYSSFYKAYHKRFGTTPSASSNPSE